MKNYSVQMEISGKTAMFTRPDTGSAPVSYPAPTYESAIAMFESIAWRKDAIYIPQYVEICSPVQYAPLSVNYGGPLRKSSLKSGDNSQQIKSVVACNVCYRLYALIRGSGIKSSLKSPGHALKIIFEKRLNRGQQYRTPCLGLKEFVPTYWGPFREKTKVQADINETIPSMLKSVWSAPLNGEYSPTFIYNVRISNGVLRYDQ